MRLFRFNREQDVSGKSGTGIVAEGVLFDDGAAVLRWRPNPHGSIVYWPAPNALTAMTEIHGHEGKTVIEFLQFGAEWTSGHLVMDEGTPPTSRLDRPVSRELEERIDTIRNQNVEMSQLRDQIRRLTTRQERLVETRQVGLSEAAKKTAEEYPLLLTTSCEYCLPPSSGRRGFAFQSEVPLMCPVCQGTARRLLSLEELLILDRTIRLRYERSWLAWTPEESHNPVQGSTPWEAAAGLVVRLATGD